VELVGFTVLRPIYLTIDIPVGSQVFPSYVQHKHGVTKQSALAKLKEERVLWHALWMSHRCGDHHSDIQ
jgi:hypothetical protein